ncbi:MAG: enolase C-terminal domain-like protein [Actinomycetes bacterium]
MRWQLQRRIHELLTPSQAAHGAVVKRELLLLRITDGDHVGWGEAAPIFSYNGVTVDQADSELRKCLELLGGQDPDDPEATLNGLDTDLSGPSRAALEVALRDLASRRSGISVLQSLGGSEPSPIQLRALLTATSVAEAGVEAESAVSDGYQALKAKIGLSNDFDLKRLEEIREASPDGVKISADANGAFALEDALTFLKQADGLIDLAEQPVSGLDAMRALHQRASVQTALDEDATIPGAMDTPMAADSVCLKLQAWGGIDRLVEAAGVAHQAGLTVTYGSTLEGPVGITASLIAADLAPADLPSGLGTLSLFKEDFPALVVRSGALAAPSGAGLGTGPEGVEC